MTMRKAQSKAKGLQTAHLPPSDIDAEQAVLGAVLIEQSAIITVFKELTPEMFYKESHMIICEACFELYSESRKIDLITVSARLQTKGLLEQIGGAYYLTELMDRVVSADHREAHAEIIKKHYKSRELIKVFTQSISNLYSFNDPDNISFEVSNSISAIQEGSPDENEYSMRELAMRSIREIEEKGDKIVEYQGYSTSIVGLDRCLGGIKQPDFTIVAARPAMGKTAVANVIAMSLSKQIPTVFFTMEMSADQIYGRMLASESGVESKRIKRNDLNPTHRNYLSSANQYLAELGLTINDTPAYQIDKLIARLKILKKKENIGAAVIDYLGLIPSSEKGNGNAHASITEITAKLKKACKQLKISIILLAQLSRAVEGRKDEMYRPKLSDLRDSGSIEQDADNVVFLWRPEYYEIKDMIPVRCFNTVQTFNPNNLLLFIVAKCRDGETKTVPAHIDLSKMQVKDHPDIEMYYRAVDNPKLPF